jgi:thiamine biosynthesis lipoprotein
MATKKMPERRASRRSSALASIDTPTFQAAGIAMDTVVSIHVAPVAEEAVVRPALWRALDWFAVVERACSRFDPNSELRQLVARPGRPVQVSPVLFEAVRFAVALARATGGAFDPTLGRLLERHGFDRHYVTGQTISSPEVEPGATYRHVQLGPGRTITLRRPLVLDLGAVAKGLAIDLAACELSAFEDFCVEAGGDLFAGGHTPDGRPWRVGIQDPRHPDLLASTLEVSDRGVCTSGDYQRRSSDGQAHHLLDPRTGQSALELASVSVVAPTAMAADGLATAAFILGLEGGRRLLEASNVSGVFITALGELHATADTGTDTQPAA